MLAKRKMSVTELSEKVGITTKNISDLKNGRQRRSGMIQGLIRSAGRHAGEIFLEYVEEEGEENGDGRDHDR